MLQKKWVFRAIMYFWTKPTTELQSLRPAHLVNGERLGVNVEQLAARPHPGWKAEP